MIQVSLPIFWNWKLAWINMRSNCFYKNLKNNFIWCVRIKPYNRLSLFGCFNTIYWRFSVTKLSGIRIIYHTKFRKKSIKKYQKHSPHDMLMAFNPIFNSTTNHDFLFFTQTIWIAQVWGNIESTTPFRFWYENAAIFIRLTQFWIYFQANVTVKENVLVLELFALLCYHHY